MSKVVKKVGKAIKKVVKGVVKGVKKVWKKIKQSKVLKVIAAAALVYFGGAAIMGGARRRRWRRIRRVPQRSRDRYGQRMVQPWQRGKFSYARSIWRSWIKPDGWHQRYDH